MVDIIHRIGIKAPATKVYEALATAQGVVGWWTRDTTGSSKVGGKQGLCGNREGKAFAG